MKKKFPFSPRLTLSLFIYGRKYCFLLFCFARELLRQCGKLERFACCLNRLNSVPRQYENVSQLESEFRTQMI